MLWKMNQEKNLILFKKIIAVGKLSIFFQVLKFKHLNIVKKASKVVFKVLEK